MASPDQHVGVAGSYFYDWARDGALSMRAYMELNDYEISKIESNMQSYLKWVLNL